MKELFCRICSGFIWNKQKRKNFRKQHLKKVKQPKSLKDKIQNLEQRVLYLEAEIVRKSGLWDENYYIRTYHPEMRKHEALMHYMTKGWQNNESPSPLLDASLYNCKLYTNPILDYVLRGQYQLTRLFFENKYLPSNANIKINKVSQKVVYTCITNNYDDIENIRNYHCTDTSWHYVCFTDNQEWIEKKQIGIWKIQPLAYTELDNTRNNRWHKCHPHILFPKYEESIYIDANINIISEKFWNMLSLTDKDILLPIHSERIDLYKELIWAKEMRFDENILIDEQYRIIKETGFPENYGMFENNIIYRKHNQKEIISMMEEWWSFIKDYCRRDQCSLAYIFWKYNRKIKDYAFENTRIDYQNFCLFPHNKQYERLKK